MPTSEEEVLAWVEPLLASAQQKVTAAEAAVKAKHEQCSVLRFSLEAKDTHIRKLEAAAAQNAHKNHQREWDLVEKEVLGLTVELREARDALSVAHGRLTEAEESKDAADERSAVLQEQIHLLQERLAKDEKEQMERCCASLPENTIRVCLS
jgi:multidrug resistance efflux pump